MLAQGPSIEERLRQIVKAGSPTTGEKALLAVEEAEGDALATVFSLPGGGDIAVEPTRALTAIDVDLGARDSADSNAPRVWPIWPPSMSPPVFSG